MFIKRFFLREKNLTKKLSIFYLGDLYHLQSTNINFENFSFSKLINLVEKIKGNLKIVTLTVADA